MTSPAFPRNHAGRMDSRLCSMAVPEPIVGVSLPKRPRVLIAEDHPGVAKAVCRVLALDCDVVGSVADGSAVLEAAQRLQPDVIVVDLNLPNVNGLEACRQITQVNPEAKVIVFSAMNDPDVTQRFSRSEHLPLYIKGRATAACYRPSNACVMTEVDQADRSRSRKRSLSSGQVRPSSPAQVEELDRLEMVGRTADRGGGPRTSSSEVSPIENHDCDRTVIRQAQNLEEHRGLPTHTE